MTLKLFRGFGYFFYLSISILVAISSFFLLKNRTDTTKKRVISGFLFFALAVHFLKLLFPPYVNDINAIRKITPENICALSTLMFPFIFLGNNKYLKDYMFYIGVISGTLAIVFPLEPLDKDAYVFAFDTIRFYVCHMIITIAPFLMVATGLHKLNYRRVIFVPVMFIVVLAIIMINEVILMELGLVPLRSNDLFDPDGYRNFSMIFGLNDDYGAAGKIVTFFTPSIFLRIPQGEYAGEAKFWPLLWIIVPTFVIIGGLSFLISLIWEHKRVREDLVLVKNYFLTTFKKSR